MPSYLGMYPNCADRREKRFVFAVESFLEQTGANKHELVVVSDGCNKTTEIIKKYNTRKNIKLIEIKRSKPFSGDPHNTGIEMASGDLICYLDTDDFIGPDHLEIIESQFDQKTMDWAYYDDYAYVGRNYFKKRSTGFFMKEGRMVMGTCSIVHKKELSVKWGPGYGHDHNFINTMKKFKFAKLKKRPQYFVCHIPVSGGDFNIDKPQYCYT